MANYSLVVNSKFRPFELEEMLKPVMAAEQAHKEIEAAYGDLATKANIWDKLTNAETDKVSHKMYSNYADSLEKEVNELAKHGLSLTSRQALTNLRGRYAREIIPIETAYKKREEERKRQREAMDKSGGNMVFSRDAATTSLDNYLNDIEDYSQVNLDNVLKYGMAAGKAISDRNVHTKEGRLFNGDYFDLITTKGYTPKQAIDILRNTGRYPEFDRFIKDELTKIGVSEGSNLYSSPDADRIKSALYEGLNMGITYDRKDSPMANWRAQKDLDEYYKSLRSQPAEPIFNPTISLGASGEPDPDLDGLKGLRKMVVEGVSIPMTDAATKYGKEVENLNKQLEDFKANHGNDLSKYDRRFNRTGATSKTATGVGSYSTIGKAMSDNLSNPAPPDYLEYERIRKALDEKKKKYKESTDFLLRLSKEYSGYGRDDYEAVETAKKIKEAKRGQQDYVKTLNLTGSAYKDILGNFRRNLSTSGFNLVDVSTGKKLDKEDAISLLDTRDSSNSNVALGVVNKGGKVFFGVFDANGNVYKVGGMEHLDRWSDKVTNIDKRLGDFGPRTKDQVVTLSGTGTVSMEQAMQQARRKGKVARDTNGLEWCTVKVQGTNDIYNLVKDTKTGALYMQSLDDELYNNGNNRGRIIANMSNAALTDLKPTIAHSPQTKILV